MQIRTFILPATSASDVLEDLNSFLRSVRILEVKKEFVSGENGAYWALCVTFLPVSQGTGNFVGTSSIKGKVDYKNLLDKDEFSRFCLLRKIRKKLADADAVPAFAVFTDAELAEISKIKNLDILDLKKIDGIGVRKVDKYGQQLCDDYNLLLKEDKLDTDET